MHVFQGNGRGMGVSCATGAFTWQGRPRVRPPAGWCSGVAKNRALPVSYAPHCLVPGNWCLLCVIAIPIAPLARSKEKSIVSHGFA